MRLRQIALAARDIDAAYRDISTTLGVTHAYRDPEVGRYGLCNVVFPVGDTFLEVVSPKEAGTTVERLLDKRGGDGGYMVILQTQDIAAARARVAEAGVRVVDQADRDGAAMTHLHPRDVGGAILSIDWMATPSRWDWAGPGWEDHVTVDRVEAVVGAELQGDAPDRMAERWSAALGLPAKRDGDSWRIVLDGSELRFAPLKDERGDGLYGIDLRARDPAAVRRDARRLGLDGAGSDLRLCGVHVWLKDS